MSRNLPSRDIGLSAGIATNITPSAVIGTFLREAKNIDGYSLFRGIGKVPGSDRVSDDHGAAVASLHQFEFTDLDLVRKRHQLSLSGGTLRLINANKSLTTLDTGFTDEPLVGEAMLDRFYLTGPNQRGLETGGVKYDGTNVRPWGILAPGQEITTLVAIDDDSSWSAGTDTAISASTVSKDGDGSLQVDKTGTSGTSASATRSGLSLDLDADAGDDTVLIWVFLPYGSFQALATSGTAVEIALGTSGLTNADLHQYTLGEVQPGWNLLSMVVSSPDDTDGSGATTSNITDLRVQFNTSASSKTLSGVRFDRLYTTDEGKPTAAVGSAGNLSGTKTYRVTFVDENGVESNAGLTSDPVTTDGDQVDLTDIPVSSNPGVIARRIYRDDSSDKVWRFVSEIFDNVTTTFTDDVGGSSLELTTPPIEGDGDIDHTPPGRMVDTVKHQNRIVGISAEDEFTLIITEANLPEAARIVDQIQLEERLRHLEGHSLGTLIYGQDKLFLLTGDGSSRAFRVDEVNPELGTDGRRTVVRQKGINITAREGELYGISHPSDPWLINSPVLDQWRDIADREDSFFIHDRGRFRIVAFGKSSSGGAYDTVWVLQYGTRAQQQITGEGSGVDPLDVRNGVWWKLELPGSIDPQCAEIVERTPEEPELWVGGGDGYVYHLQPASGTIDWATALTTSAVSAEFETWEVPLGDSAGSRGTPRFLQFNAEASVASTWTITVTLLDDADGRTVASTSFNVTIGPGADPQIVPIPGLRARAEWCRIKFSNANAGEDGIFRPPLRLFYIPRVDFRGPRD